ncbi:MAG TPA: spore coat protein GerQ [Bacillota bacterium]|nr:spore coat protein GerQ [Bacillota bacterium]
MNQPYPYYYYQPYQPYTYPYYYQSTTQPVHYPAEQHMPATRQQANEHPMDNAEMLPLEQSYIENILRLNRGKQAVVYMTIDQETKTFEGIIEAAGRDHIILSDPETDRRYLLLMVYLDYVVFHEEIEYEYPFDGAQNQLANYPQR